MNRIIFHASVCVLLLALSACTSVRTAAVSENSSKPSITPFLLFQDGNAEEAMRFYVSLFDDGELISVERYGPESGAPEGTLFLGEFQIKGQAVRCTDSPIEHAFSFTPAISLFVDCSSEEELEGLAAKLQQGGEALMPLDDYGFSKKFAWVQDRYGVSWQLNLPFSDEQ